MPNEQRPTLLDERVPLANKRGSHDNIGVIVVEF
jgi:serine/threonine protein phosphatase PrpC